MRRYFIKVGDRTTKDGIVIEGVDSSKHHGTPLSFLGAEVYCHACKSVGRIAPQGPRRPFRMMGKEAALDNDICLCKCEPAPRLIASQNTMSQSFDQQELETMGYAPHRVSASQNDSYDQQFLLRDLHTGKPLADRPYRITTEDSEVIEGRTDASGCTRQVFSNNAVNATIQVFEEHAPIKPDWDRYL